MSVALSGILGNMTLFIQVYLCGLYLPNKYNNGGTAAEKGETWAGGRGKSIFQGGKVLWAWLTGWR